jgi:transcriptional regulator of nitric oxide reductase
MALTAWFTTTVLGNMSAIAADLAIARQFFNGYDSVTVEAVHGTPPSAIVRGHDGRVVGYAFSTRDVSGSVGYSGRPLEIVAAVTPEGILAGAMMVAQEEPILVIGITPEVLAAYVAGFKGFDVRTSGLRELPKGGMRAPQAVAGATVTSAVIRDALIRSARAVLRSRVRDAASITALRLDRETRRRASWDALVGDGALRRLVLSRGDAARLLQRSDPEPDKIFIDLWLAVVTPPSIGENLLGRRLYESEIAKIGLDDDLVLIAANGLYSFKGTTWRRTGIFDRIELHQNTKTIRLRADDHVRLDALQADGSPEMREIGLYRLSRGTGFDAGAPFRLTMAIDGGPASAPPTVAKTVSLDYSIPKNYLIGPTEPSAPPTVTSMPDAASVPRATEEPPARLDKAAPEASAEGLLWQEIWWARRFEIAILTLMLSVLGVVLIFQNGVTSHRRLYQGLRVGYLALTLVFLGVIANAQLSVVHVVTFAHALLTGFRWELFLLDPIVFILWSCVAVSMLFWGRGVFCGWLCPFGALQELLNRFAQAIGIKQIEVPFGVHERLWMIKYIFFLSIFAISLHSVTMAFQFSEVEPFKTAITLKFMRAWPFVAYAGVLLMAGLFIQRFYCRYLCPLGAALAIPARLRMFEWLKRYRECGAECQICARRCTVQAIHPLGQINPNECIYCLQCQAHYFDSTVCLHLKKRAARRRPGIAASAVPPAGTDLGAPHAS